VIWPGLEEVLQSPVTVPINLYTEIARKNTYSQPLWPQ